MPSDPPLPDVADPATGEGDADAIEPAIEPAAGVPRTAGGVPVPADGTVVAVARVGAGDTVTVGGGVRASVDATVGRGVGAIVGRGVEVAARTVMTPVICSGCTSQKYR